MNRNIVKYGSAEPLPKQIPLRAGNLDMIYENGFLRYISAGEVEVLRMINHALRDHDWDTVPTEISDEEVNVGRDKFSITYKMHCKKGNVDFLWNCTIIGDSDSTVTFTIKGKVLSDFSRNRIGFTVLHPIETCIGKDCIITHPDGTKSIKTFPQQISPHQPFFNIENMEWALGDHSEVKIAFEGDVFETEDQRNWTDASYKTYCTPLGNPFPVALKSGNKVSQTIKLQYTGPKEPEQKKEKTLTYEVHQNHPIPFPEVGLTYNKLVPSSAQISLLRELGINFLRVELKTRKLDEEHLQNAMEVAEELECKLEVALFFEKAISDDFINLLKPAKNYISRFILLPLYAKSTEEELINTYVPILQEHFPDSEIGGGTDAFFKELNTFRTMPEKLDFLSFSINPQVHAFDIHSLTESIAAQSYVVETGKILSKGKDIRVGPVTLKMRWNPNATSDSKEPNEMGSLRADADSRQLSLYGAAWTMGSFKYLAESGAKSVTYFETCGVTGMMPHPMESWPSEYGTEDWQVYPMYLLLHRILKHKTGNLTPFTSSNPLTFDGMGFVDDSGEFHVLMANFTDDPIKIQVPSSARITQALILNEDNIEEFLARPEFINRTKNIDVNDCMILPPFGIAFVQ